MHFLEYTFVLNLHCQQLGNMCQLEGVYAPFGRGRGECAFSRIYICAIFRSKICLFAIFSCFSISVRGLNLPVPNLPWANLRGGQYAGETANWALESEGPNLPGLRFVLSLTRFTGPSTPTVIDRPVPELGEVGSRVAAASCLLLNK